MRIVLATIFKMTARSFLIYLEYFTNSLCVYISAICMRSRLPGCRKQVRIWGLGINRIFLMDSSGCSKKMIAIRKCNCGLLLFCNFSLCVEEIYNLLPSHIDSNQIWHCRITSCLPNSIFQIFCSFYTAVYSFTLSLFISSWYSLVTLQRFDISCLFKGIAGSDQWILFESTSIPISTKRL